eukprot:gene12374-16598_t
MKPRIQRHSNRINYSKLIVMVLFLLFDVALNSTLDYGTFNNTIPHNFLLGLLGLQVVIQISILLILFLATADTYLFRIGLLGILAKIVRNVLIVQSIYIALTVVTGSYRVNRISNHTSLEIADLWRDNSFIALSHLQKIAAIAYYVVTIRVTIKLEDPIYFNKEAWVSLIKQQKKSNEIDE